MGCVVKFSRSNYVGVVEKVDTVDLKPTAYGREGSTPSPDTGCIMLPEENVSDDKILGVTEISVTHDVYNGTRISLELLASPLYDVRHFAFEDWDQIFPGNVIITCQYCGQWAARFTACGKCGAPVE